MASPPSSEDSRAAGDGGDDAHHIRLLHRCALFLQVADVLVVQINVDEAAQLAVVGVEVPAQVAVLGDELLQELPHRLRLQVQRLLLAGVLPERRRDDDLRHRYLASAYLDESEERIGSGRNWLRSSASTHEVVSWGS